MRKVIGHGCAIGALLLLSANMALACHVSGRVLCPAGGPLEGVRIDVVSTDGDPFSGTATTDVDGEFTLALPAVLACYTATVVAGDQKGWLTPPDGQREFCIVHIGPSVVLEDFVIQDSRCAEPQASQPETWGLLKSAYR